MVDSEDITLEKIKTQELLLRLILSSIPFNKILLFKKRIQNLHTYKPWNLTKNLNLNLKFFFRFVIKTIILFQHVIVDPICLMHLNPNQNHLLPVFINILKHPPIRLILKLLDTVVEVIVTPTSRSYSRSNSRSQYSDKLYPNNPNLHTMIVIAPTMTNT